MPQTVEQAAVRPATLLCFDQAYDCLLNFNEKEKLDWIENLNEKFFLFDFEIKFEYYLDETNNNKKKENFLEKKFNKKIKF